MSDTPSGESRCLFDADPIRRWATFSEDRCYRYSLAREWSDGSESTGRVTFIGLNPSTADETEDDPTIRRCIRFAKDWGYGGVRMVNLFAWRATDPRELAQVEDPVGVGNDEILRTLDTLSTLIVAAWGAHPMAVERAKVVVPMLPSFTVLGLTAEGHPRHPLYMKASCRPLNPLTLAAAA